MDCWRKEKHWESEWVSEQKQKSGWCRIPPQFSHFCLLKRLNGRNVLAWQINKRPRNERATFPDENDTNPFLLSFSFFCWLWSSSLVLPARFHLLKGLKSAVSLRDSIHYIVTQYMYNLRTHLSLNNEFPVILDNRVLFCLINWNLYCFFFFLLSILRTK